MSHSKLKEGHIQAHLLGFWCSFQKFCSGQFSVAFSPLLFCLCAVFHLDQKVPQQEILAENWENFS